MSRRRSAAGRRTARLIFGLFVVAVGIVFTLDRLGLAEARPILRYWPLVLVALGLARALEPGCPPCRVFGGLIALLGGGLLLDNLDVIDLDWDLLFPLLLVLVGGTIVWKALGGGRRHGPGGGGAGGGDGDREGDTVDATALFSAVGRRPTTRSFRGGDVSAILGACDIDLRQAGLAEGGAKLDVFAFWGGVEVRVPADWRIEVVGTPLLGGFTDQTRQEGIAAGDERKLVIDGLALMGGVEVKN